MMPSSVLGSSRRKPLVAGVAAAFALASPEAFATVVATCDEAALRTAVSSTGSGGMVDMSGLTACTITLTTGAITVTQNALIIKGPSSRVAITAQGSPVQDRIFNHTGTGNFELMNVNVEYGYDKEPLAHGGCITSAGNAILMSSGVYHCTAHSSDIANGTALGGGAYAKGVLFTKYGTLTNNTAYAATRPSLGGGGYAYSGLIAKYSAVRGNVASGLYGRGGGLVVAGGSTSISNTTISGNHATQNYGGLRLTGGTQATITNSTISGNVAANGVVGGIFASTPTVTIRNSTIAFNSAQLGKLVTEYLAPGLALRATSTSITANLQSTLISNNTYGSMENDFSAVNVGPNTVNFSGGAANLIRFANGLASVGSIAITGVCPLLGPLRDNGGASFTHALMSGSPAIDHGNNTASPQLNEDQRGLFNDTSPYPYPRASSPPGVTTAIPDIGAYEVQWSDIIFNSGFEGCP